MTTVPPSAAADSTSSATFDRVGAFALIALISPLLLIVALFVWFGPRGRGPAIFRQERVGKDGKPTRVGFKIQADGNKVRIAKRSGAEIDG